MLTTTCYPPPLCPSPPPPPPGPVLNLSARRDSRPVFLRKRTNEPKFLQDSTREFRKVFVYAPPSAGSAVNTMLKDMGLDKTWDAEPVSTGTPLRESGLTNILESALASARSRERCGAPFFFFLWACDACPGSSHLLCSLLVRAF